MKSKHIYEAVSKVIKPYFKDYEEYFLLLVENWYSIAPSSWKKKVFPLKLKWLSNNKAILVLKAYNNASVINLSFDTPLVIKQINAFFGREIITKIIFK